MVIFTYQFGSLKRPSSESAAANVYEFAERQQLTFQIPTFLVN
jgi:hypothetical protein